MDSTSIPFRSHTALLLAAALPYLQPAYRHPAELALKFLELNETLKLSRGFRIPDTISQGSLHKSTGPSSGLSGIMDMIYHFVEDPEGLLHSLSLVCTGKEKDIIHMLLNLMQAKSFYENYGDVLQSFMTANMSSDFPDNEPEKPASPDDFDALNLLKSLLDNE